MTADLVLSYDRVFVNPSLDIQIYLSDVPKKGALFQMLRWVNIFDLVFAERNAKSERQMQILLGVLYKCDFSSFQKVKAEKDNADRQKTKCLWLTPHTALAFIEYLLKEHYYEIFLSDTNLDIQGCINEFKGLTDAHRYNIFRAYFLIGCERGGNLKINRGMPLQELVIRSFTERVGTYELERGDEMLTYLVEYQKGVEFFEFLELEYPAELTLFLSKRKIDSWKTYLLEVAGFVLQYSPDANNSRVRVYKPAIVPYFDIFVNHESYRSPDINFLNLKKYPLLKYGEDGFVMIFRTFLFEKLFKALFFEFQSIAGRNIKSVIGLKFFEQRLCSKYISAIFSNGKATDIPGYDARFKGISGSPDHYARNWDKVFVFEAKDALISDVAKTSMDNDVVLKELANKFVRKEGTSGRAGVAQLGNFINNFEQVASRCDSDALRKKITFYPILVLHDRVLSTMGINHILDDYFQKELTAESREKYKVKPLIVIHIDCLILYLNFFSRQPKNFQDCLDDYLRFFKESKNHKNLFSFDIWMRRRYLPDDKRKAAAAAEYFDQRINQLFSQLQAFDGAGLKSGDSNSE